MLCASRFVALCRSETCCSRIAAVVARYFDRFAERVHSAMSRWLHVRQEPRCSPPMRLYWTPRDKHRTIVAPLHHKRLWLGAHEDIACTGLFGGGDKGGDHCGSSTSSGNVITTCAKHCPFGVPAKHASLLSSSLFRYRALTCPEVHLHNGPSSYHRSGMAMNRGPGSDAMSSPRRIRRSSSASHPAIASPYHNAARSVVERLRSLLSEPNTPVREPLATEERADNGAEAFRHESPHVIFHGSRNVDQVHGALWPERPAVWRAAGTSADLVFPSPASEKLAADIGFAHLDKLAEVFFPFAA